MIDAGGAVSGRFVGPGAARGRGTAAREWAALQVRSSFRLCLPRADLHGAQLELNEFVMAILSDSVLYADHVRMGPRREYLLGFAACVSERLRPRLRS